MEKITAKTLIDAERKEQIEKHNRSVLDDYNLNFKGELMDAALSLVEKETLAERMKAKPERWDFHIWEKMCRKSKKDRLVIAGALLKAEIDRGDKIMKVSKDVLKSVYGELNGILRNE